METLRNHGFPTFPQALLTNQMENPQEIIENFFLQHSLQRAIIKPAIGGSSIGVFSVTTPEEAHLRLKDIFGRKLGSEALLEPFCIGKEFTIVVFENLRGEPVALIPTEVDLSYDHNGIFDYRKKYLQPIKPLIIHLLDLLSLLLIISDYKQNKFLNCLV